jgi:YegS/Rv2252/BmrU family lipid kinase
MGYHRAALIYNPTSGRKRHLRQQKVDEAKEILARQVPRVDVMPTERAGHAAELAQTAIESGCDLLAICGGDGTLNEVIGVVANSPAAILPLQAGTANVLAEETGLPPDPPKAAAMLADLEICPVRLGKLTPESGARARRFLLMCGAGVDAKVVYNLDTDLKKYIGQGAYFLASLEQMQRPFEPFRVRIDGEDIDCTFVLISKSSMYGGHLKFAENAHLLDDTFEVVVFRADSPLRYVGYLAQAATGTLDLFDDVTFHRTTRVDLIGTAGSAVHMEVDGEYAGKAPAAIELSAETINLLLPPEYVEERRAALQSRGAEV